MPFVHVKCTSCGGDIQLDDTRERGFCVYCGAQVVFQEAVQKLVLPGDISVKGIADLEKLLQNAETFHKLNDYAKRDDLLYKVTQEYPEDYRGWLRLFQINIECAEQAFSQIARYDDYQNRGLSSTTFANMIDGVYKMAKNTLVVAPQEKRQAICQVAVDFFQRKIPQMAAYKNELDSYDAHMSAFTATCRKQAESVMKNGIEQKAKENNRKVAIRRVINSLVILAWLTGLIVVVAEERFGYGLLLGFILIPLCGILFSGTRKHQSLADVRREIDLNRYNVDELVAQQCAAESAAYMKMHPSTECSRSFFNFPFLKPEDLANRMLVYRDDLQKAGSV